MKIPEYKENKNGKPIIPVGWERVRGIIEDGWLFSCANSFWDETSSAGNKTPSEMVYIRPIKSSESKPKLTQKPSPKPTAQSVLKLSQDIRKLESERDRVNRELRAKRNDWREATDKAGK